MTVTPETPESAPTASAATPIDPEQHPALARPSRSTPIAVVAALAVGALVGGVSGAGVAIWATSLNSGTPVVDSSSPTTITVNDPANVTPVTAIAAKASPSVVTISVSSESAGGTGSGVILDTEGHVLTNAHVITLEGASGSDPRIMVTSYDGRLFSATIVGVDPLSDLAVIKLDNPDDLVPAEFGDSAALNVGDTAVMIGAPLGLSASVSDGIISALNRSITVASSAIPEEVVDELEQQDPTVPENDNTSPFDIWNFDVPGDGTEDATPPSALSSSTISLAVIQTNAGINPGSSGGALVNDEGQVIGINVALATSGGTSEQAGSIGIGFAIPANFAQRIAAELMETGTATHGLLGASVADVTEDPSQTDAEVIGASIMEITAGGAAEKAGLQVGDVVTGVNGLPITGKTDLTAQIRALPAGAEAVISYVRGGKSATVEVILGTLI